MAGDLVGDAWVAIHARDGGMSREVRAIAKNAAEDLSEGLDKEIQKETEAHWSRDKAMIARFLLHDDDKAIAAVADRWASKKDLTKAMERMLAQVDDKKIFTKLVRDMDDALDRYDGFMVDRLDESARKIVEERNKAWRRTIRAHSEALNENMWRDLERQYGRLQVELTKIVDQTGQKRRNWLVESLADWDIRSFTRHFRDLDEAIIAFDRSMVELGKSGDATGDQMRGLSNMMEAYIEKTREAELRTKTLGGMLGTELERELQRVDRAIARSVASGDWDALNKKMGRSTFLSGEVAERLADLSRQGLITRDDITLISRSYDDWNRKNRSLVATLDILPDRLGRMFGKGSRNNFLNFIGSTLSNVVGLIPATVRGFSRLGGAIRDVGTNFRLLRSQGVGSVAALGRSLTPLLASAVPALIAMGTGAVLLVKILPVMAAAISSLTGILTAWVGVLANAVSGALVAFGPLLVTAAGGAVLVAVGLGKMIAKMKELKEEGEPLPEELRAMDEALRDLNGTVDRFVDRAGPQLARTFSILLDAASGFIDAIGPGVERGLERFNNILSGDSLDKPLKVWRETMPRIFEDLAAAVGHLGAGMVKFFEPILPYAEELAENIYDMMLSFNAWAGSADGRNTIAGWMETAWSAAEDLWGTVKNVTSALGTLFNVGTEEAGGSFLENLEKITGEFDKWLKSPEGREAVSQWFKDAKEVGSELWQIIGDIGKAFDNLDTADARAELDDFLEAVNIITDGVKAMAEWIETASRKIDLIVAFATKGPTGYLQEKMKQAAQDQREAFAEMEGMAKGFDFGVELGFGTNKGLDLGAALGMTEADANELADTYLGIIDQRLAEWDPGEEMVEKGRTGLDSFFSSWIGENPETKRIVKDLFNVDGETWLEIGGNLVDGFHQGFNDSMAAAGEWMKEKMDEWVVQPVLEFFGIKSPSTLFAGIGSDVVAGFLLGLAELPGQITVWLAGLGTQLLTWFTSLPGKVTSWLSTLPASTMVNFNLSWADISSWLATTSLNLGLWFLSLPGKVGTWLAGLAGEISARFDEAWAGIKLWWVSTSLNLSLWFTSLPGKIGSWLSGVAGAIASPFEDAWFGVNSALSSLASMVAGWWDVIKSTLSRIDSAISVGRGDSRFGMPDLPFLASGGIVSSPTLSVVGEAGREAVIPLDRPLSMVDPSVRDMAAMLRGRSSGNTFEAGSIILQYAGQDPYRAAEKFLDDLALNT